MSETCLVRLLCGPDAEGRYTYRLIRGHAEELCFGDPYGRLVELALEGVELDSANGPIVFYQRID